MKQELALPENKKIVPKPTKNEIIAAMVEIAREKHDAEVEEAERKLKALEIKFQKYALSRFKKEWKERTMSADNNRYDGNFNYHLCFKADEAGSAIHVERKKLRQLVNAEFDEKGTRAMLRESLLGVSQHASRVDMLLEDKDSRAHLESVLEGIINHPAELAA